MMNCPASPPNFKVSDESTCGSARFDFRDLRLDATSNSPNFHETSRGGSLGLDTLVAPALRLGAAASCQDLDSTTGGLWLMRATP